MGIAKYVRLWLLAAAVALSAVPRTALAASEVDILLDKLVEKGVLSGVEAGLIRREISETKETRNKELAKEIVPDSARNWKWSGDIRLRDEIRDRQGTGADSSGNGVDAHRARIRFRYGAEGKVNDQLKVKFRIATGSATDPISTNQTFNNNFLKKSIFLDLANVEYAPMLPLADTKVSFVGGIMENPLWTTDPMVWDGDLSWDGFAVKGEQKLGESAKLFTNNGVFLLDSDETEPATLWVTQGGLALTPFINSETEVLKNLKLTTAVAYHSYANTFTSATNKPGTDPLTRESDNVTCCEFKQFNPTVELASTVGTVPVALFGDFVQNLGAEVQGDGDNRGFAFGIKVGKATVPWSLMKGWEAGYMFERLESDAAYDEFVDSDFGGGGTNRRGNVAWITLATLKNSTFGAKFFFRQDAIINQGSGSTLAREFREDRIQLDWVTKF